MSLRWKLALAMVAMSSLATAAFGVASYRSTEQRLIAEVDQSLDELEPMVVARGADTIAFSAGALPQYSAQYVTRDGNVIRSTFPEPVTVTIRSASSFATVETSDGQYRVRTVSMPNGVMMVGRPLAETHRVLEGVRQRTILLIVLVAVVAAALGVLLADRITAPLRRLTAAADDVAETGRPARGLDLVSDSGTKGDEVGRLHAGFGRMLRALARSQDEQERLVQDAGHELRTPLTSLRTNLDVLARYPDIDAAQRSAIVADLQAEVGELAELVDEIVAVAGGGLAAGAGSEAPTEFDLTAVARTIAERFSRRAGRDVVVTGEPLAVTAERTGVQRSISCLIDNACKFDPSGAPVEVRVGRLAGVVRVDVRDHGPGIPDDELALVFDRFHRAVEARTLPGSGLGLAIVRAVAERHGGTAWAENHPGGGAVVGFTLASVLT